MLEPTRVRTRKCVTRRAIAIDQSALYRLFGRTVRSSNYSPSMEYFSLVLNFEQIRVVRKYFQVENIPNNGICVDLIKLILYLYNYINFYILIL